MGEIKSTLDIIMEKAKNLEVTEEEKVQIRKKEIEDKGKGMVQKFLDRVLRTEDIISEIGFMDEQAQEWIKKSILDDCMERINIERSNEDMLELVEKVLGLNPAPIRALIERFQKQLTHEAEKIRAKLAQELQEKGIRGSAVIANHKASAQWASLEAQLHEEFEKQLDELLRQNLLTK